MGEKYNVRPWNSHFLEGRKWGTLILFMFLICQVKMIFLSLNFIDFDKLWTLSCFRESHRGIDFYVKKICRINICSLLKACGGHREQTYWIKCFSDQHAEKPMELLIGCRMVVLSWVSVTSVAFILAYWNSQSSPQKTWLCCPCQDFYSSIPRPPIKLFLLPQSVWKTPNKTLTVVLK